jgi:hypothetical protein
MGRVPIYGAARETQLEETAAAMMARVTRPDAISPAGP